MSDTSSKTDTDEISETCIKCPHFYRSVEKHEKKYDMVHICSVAISTVMLMASRSYKDITSEHVKCMKMHFRNLKEDDYPHNITHILQILENLRKSGMLENIKEEEVNMEVNEHIPIDDLIN